MALTSTLVSFKHVHCFYLMRPHVTHTLGHTFLFHSCVSRARTSHGSALSPLVSSYGVCQLTAMGFFTLMKGSAPNVCTFFNVQGHFKEFSIAIHCWLSCHNTYWIRFSRYKMLRHALSPVLANMTELHQFLKSFIGYL